MNQDTLKRLFKSIEGEPTDDIVKIAYKIIDDEKNKGHLILAKQLGEILESNIRSTQGIKKELKSIFSDNAIPLSKRNQVPLAISIERDNLRHDMILPKEIEERFLRIEKEYVAKERLAHYGLKPKQKILFYGSPGCGKSMGAERIAWNIGLPFLKVRFEAIISSYLGESATNLRNIFESIKTFPCVLLLDEFDFIAKARTQGQDVGEMSRIVNMLLYLLEEYDGPGLLIATTNIEGSIDKALFRRFDEVLELPKPNKDDIYKLLRLSLSTMNLSNEINWESIIGKIKDFSAAQIVKIANDAAKFSIIDNTKYVEHKHIEKALKESLQFKI